MVSNSRTVMRPPHSSNHLVEMHTLQHRALAAHLLRIDIEQPFDQAAD
jgi:hypothetical protein